jgi:hypothetical protein
MSDLSGPRTTLAEPARHDLACTTGTALTST